ncbi:MAG: 2-hydroxyacid dehydrogenase [Proteobacteria bacterium]|nr:2-hydroxyacid dehydrogenase [Pseudomonadota bacterium]
MTQNILMMGPLPADQMRELEENYTVFKLWQESDPEEALNRIREKITGMVSVFGVNVSAKLIKALPNLEIIAHDSVGFDNIDVAAAKERGVIVTNSGGIVADDVADLAIGLVLGVFRRMVEADIYVRSGQWARRGDMPLGRTLKGKTIGIVGLGRIGKAIAKRAEAFGMNVIYFGPNRKQDVLYDYYEDIGKLAADSDVLMLSCLYSPATHHLVNAKVLRSLGRDGVLINVARGKVVDEHALIDALEGGLIGGAGLDVFENEPDVPSSFCRLDNVVLQPHQASATVETRTAMNQLVVDNLKLYFERAEVLTPVW